MKKITFLSLLLVTVLIISLVNISIYKNEDSNNTSLLSLSNAFAIFGEGSDTTEGEATSAPCTISGSIRVEKHSWERYYNFGLSVEIIYTGSLAAPSAGGFGEWIEYKADESYTYYYQATGVEYLCPGDEDNCQVIPCNAQVPSPPSI